MSTTTITKKVTIAGMVHFLIRKERTIPPNNTKTTYSNICQNHSYIPNNPIPETTKL